jgi:hypothetical protein
LPRTWPLAYHNHRGQRCAEMLRLGAHGRAVEGHAHYLEPTAKAAG